MAWLSRNNFTPSDFIHADDLNNLANDQRTWGGDVNGGGFTLSNVQLVGVTTGAAAAVTSVFGRTGDVVAASGDYTAAQVGAVPVARQVLAGSGMTGGGALSADVTLSAQVSSVFGRIGAVTLTPADITGATGVLTSRKIQTGTGLAGGGDLSADLTLSVVPDSINQQVQVLNAGTTVSTRHAINFISGANVTVTVADNAAANRVDVTLVSTGGSGGMSDPTTRTQHDGPAWGRDQRPDPDRRQHPAARGEVGDGQRHRRGGQRLRQGRCSDGPGRGLHGESNYQCR
jgi:hypothetical protein